MATRDGMTSAQKEQQRVKAIAQEILDALNEYRGRKNMTKGEFAEFIGVYHNTYAEWNRRGADKSRFSQLMLAAIRCGIKLEVRRSD